MFATFTLIADREDFDADDFGQPRPPRADAPGAAPGDVRATVRPAALDPDTAEHDARCLMNLIGLLSHCLRNDMFPEEERRRWRLELAEAEEKLGRLRRAA